MYCGVCLVPLFISVECSCIFYIYVYLLGVARLLDHGSLMCIQIVMSLQDLYTWDMHYIKFICHYCVDHIFP